MDDIVLQKGKMRCLMREMCKKENDMSFQSSCINNLSIEAINNVIKLESFQKAEIVMSYLSMEGEIETDSFINTCFNMGKIVCVPLINSKLPGHMEAIAINDLSNDLKVGLYGIREPIDSFSMIDPSRIDFMLIPGVAFDKCKMRLGRGAGFYDKFLSRVSPCCVKVGVCFDYQLLETVPTEQHDKSMDLIVTPRCELI